MLLNHLNGNMLLVTWYSRYVLSYRDLKEIAAERGFELNHSTVYRWVQEYAPEINKRMKPHFKKYMRFMNVNEMYVKIKGVWHYLYRAIDKEGNTLDWMLSKYRNENAAKCLFKKLLGNLHRIAPRVINIDNNPSFPPALCELQAENKARKNIKLRAIKYLNNRMENDAVK